MKYSMSTIVGDLKESGFKLSILFVIVLISFILLNTFAVVYSLISTKLSYKFTIYTCIGCLIIGFIFIILALLIYYRYIISYGLKIAYPYLEPFFKKISFSIISKVYNTPSKKLLSNSGIKKTLDWKNSLNETYQNRAPWILKKIIPFLINKIPFVSLLNQTQNKCKEGNFSKDEVGNLFYSEIDTYVRDTFFGGFSLKWIAILFFINLLAQLVFLVFMANNF